LNEVKKDRDIVQIQRNKKKGKGMARF
jgi:hypothetical protein